MKQTQLLLTFSVCLDFGQPFYFTHKSSVIITVLSCSGHFCVGCGFTSFSFLHDDRSLVHYSSISIQKWVWFYRYTPVSHACFPCVAVKGTVPSVPSVHCLRSLTCPVSTSQSVFTILYYVVRYLPLTTFSQALFKQQSLSD